MGYFGSKATTGLCQALLGLQPPHDLYIETHLGGGAEPVNDIETAAVGIY